MKCALVLSALALSACGSNVDSGAAPAPIAVATDPPVYITSVKLRPDGQHEVHEYSVTREQYQRMVEVRAHQQAATTPDDKIAVEGEVGTLQQAISQETTCMQGSAIWIYQQNVAPSSCYNGSGVSPGHMLCVWGAGEADLSTFTRKSWQCLNAAGEPCACWSGGTCGSNVVEYTHPQGWRHAVLSFWPGNESGAFLDYDKTSCNPYCGVGCYRVACTQSFTALAACTSANGIVQAADTIRLN